MMDKAAYLRREMLVSASIGAALSAVIFWATFGLESAVPVWGAGGFASDKGPQSLGIGFLAALVPGLLCRKAIQSGAVRGTEGQAPSIGAVFGKAITSAIIAALVAGGGCALILWLGGWQEIGAMIGWGLTTIYGAILAPIVTRLFLGRMLG